MIGLILMILAFAGMWKTFEKAGMEGWKGIVPVYNMYLLITEIAKKPWWYLLLLFVPIANIVIMIIVSIEIAKAFGKGTGFGVGLALLSFVFYPLLGFGDAVYTELGTVVETATDSEEKNEKLDYDL